MSFRKPPDRRLGTAMTLTTTTSSYLNSSGKTQDATCKTNSLFNMSICSNATTAAEIGRSSTVMCLVKGRGKAITETGLASMDLRRNMIRMSQFCDDQLYSQLLTQVHMVDPMEIVVAQTLRESSVLDQMFEKLNRNFPKAKVHGIPRRYMNEPKGREFIKNLCSRDSAGVDVALESKVYALLAVSGLITYVEELLSVYLAPHTVRMVYHSSANCMLMDHGTAINLELLRSTGCYKTGKQSAPCLYTVMNHTNTLTGAITLRANLLQPPTDRNLIEARYEAVDELTDNIEMFTSLQSALVKFPDIERVVSLCIQIPRLENRCTSESKIRSALCLKTALDLVPCITEVLRPAKCTLIKNLRQRLMNGGLERILQLIVDKLNSNATVTSGVNGMRGQVVFAVKQGLDGKLDAMRDVYNSLIDQTEETLQFLSETYQLALRLTYTGQRGFHCTLKIPKNYDTPSIPTEFIKVTKGKGMYSMTTDKLVILNARITECLDSICNLSNRIITNLLSEVHKEIPCLNSLVHAIGYLDMLVSFASLSRQPGYVKPELGDLLALKAARHPVAEVNSATGVVPNDLYLTQESNFMIITGANNSGKSFYLRTVAVIQVMAQIGCFVPAAFAMIRICDQLFSRIGSDNSLNNMESSFTVEMKEISFVLKHKTPTALVILDELCRGTSTHEAVDICFTICQQFLQMSAFTLFATHFKELCQLETAYSNCTNYCFVTKYEDSGSGHIAQKIVNDHKLKRGIAKGSRYGLKLAATMNFPSKVIKNSFAIANRLDGIQNEDMGDSNSTSDSSVDRLISKIYDEITLIVKHGGSLTEKSESLQQLQSKYRNRVGELKAVATNRRRVETNPSVGSDPFKDDVLNNIADIEGTEEGSATPGGGNDVHSSKTFKLGAHAACASALLESESVECESASQSLSDDRITVNDSVRAATVSSVGLVSSCSNARAATVSEKFCTSIGTTCAEECVFSNDKKLTVQHYSINSSPALSGGTVSSEHMGSLNSSSMLEVSNHRFNNSHVGLVDYGMSSIDISGSLLDNQHSVITSPSKTIYRASTRKSRDPHSPGMWQRVLEVHSDDSKSPCLSFQFNKSSESVDVIEQITKCNSAVGEKGENCGWANLVKGPDNSAHNSNNVLFPKDYVKRNSLDRSNKCGSSLALLPPTTMADTTSRLSVDADLSVSKHTNSDSALVSENTGPFSRQPMSEVYQSDESLVRVQLPLAEPSSPRLSHANTIANISPILGASTVEKVERGFNSPIRGYMSLRHTHGRNKRVLMAADTGDVTPVSHRGVGEMFIKCELTKETESYIKPKSVTFGNDEIIMSGEGKMCAPMDKVVMPAVKILKHDSAAKENKLGAEQVVVRVNEDILNKTMRLTELANSSPASLYSHLTQLQSGEGSRNVNQVMAVGGNPSEKMELVDELLNCTRQSLVGNSQRSKCGQQLPVCFSKIKVEPK